MQPTLESPPGHPDDVLLQPGDPFTAAELQVMAHRGMLAPILPGLYRLGTGPATVRHRVLALQTVAGSHLAGQWCAVGLSASWVHCGGPPPTRLEAAVSHFHRLPSQPGLIPFALRQVDVAGSSSRPAEAEHDVIELHGLRLTTVERTVEDLLRWPPEEQDREAHRQAVQALLSLARIERLRERMTRRRRLPGMVSALRALDRTLAGSSV